MSIRLVSTFGEIFFNGKNIFVRPRSAGLEMELSLGKKEWQNFCALLKQTEKRNLLRAIAGKRLREYRAPIRRVFGPTSRVSSSIKGITLGKGAKGKRGGFIGSFELRNQLKATERKNILKTGLRDHFEICLGKASVTFARQKFVGFRNLCLKFDECLKQKGWLTLG